MSTLLWFVVGGVGLYILKGLTLLYQYERGVVFTLGRFSGIREPGLRFVWPIFQSVRRVDMRIKTAEVLTLREVQERLQKAERALELATLHTYQANVDKTQAEAASTLVKALDQTPDAIVQIDSLVLVKMTDGAKARLIVRSLSQQELLNVQKSPDLLQDPGAMMKLLSSGVQSPESNDARTDSLPNCS